MILDVHTIAIVVYTAISLNNSFSSCMCMRQEHVILHDVEVSDLYDKIRQYLKEHKLDIIHEEKEDNYWALKAHKGTAGSVVIGNVRDVEVMISGNERNYEVILRTGAWGRDIIVPAAIAGALTAGLAAIPAAGVAAYRAHAFEKNFWNYIQKTIAEIGKGKATMSEPVTVSP